MPPPRVRTRRGAKVSAALSDAAAASRDVLAAAKDAAEQVAAS
jgi:hypothetical protein